MKAVAKKKVVKVNNKIKMRLIDRLFVEALLPKIGKDETLICVRDIRKKIVITEEENKRFKVVRNGDNIDWNTQGEKYEKEIEFSELELFFVKKFLKDANEKEAIPEVCLDFYLKNK